MKSTINGIEVELERFTIHATSVSEVDRIRDAIATIEGNVEFLGVSSMRSKHSIHFEDRSLVRLAFTRHENNS